MGQFVVNAAISENTFGLRYRIQMFKYSGENKKAYFNLAKCHLYTKMYVHKIILSSSVLKFVFVTLPRIKPKCLLLHL